MVPVRQVAAWQSDSCLAGGHAGQRPGQPAGVQWLGDCMGMVACLFFQCTVV
jgi:hypothetical protein